MLLPLSLLVSPKVVYGFILIEQGEMNPKAATSGRREHEQQTQASSAAPNPAESAIPEPISEELLALKSAILTYFKTEKPYLRKDFKVHDVALQLNIPAHHISYCFSVCFDESFSQLKTRYRIDYAIGLLQDGAASDMTIEAIGQQAGFASKSSFFTAFKEATGVTPLQYLS
jgi:AraC-like DNA-binding protein